MSSLAFASFESAEMQKDSETDRGSHGIRARRPVTALSTPTGPHLQHGDQHRYTNTEASTHRHTAQTPVSTFP